MNVKTALCIVLVFIFSFSGVCLGASASSSAEPGKTTGRDAVKETKGTAQTAGESAKVKKDEYTRSVEQEYNRLVKKIDELKDSTSNWASEQYRTQTARLEASREAAGRKLDELRKASSEKWESIKKDVDSAMNDLKASYEDVVARIKKG